MICRKTMAECQTPSMCTPFGGCPDHAQDARRLIKPAKALIDESGFGYEEGAIYSSQKADHELGEPDAWLVPWCRANGDAGTNVYVKKSDAENAAKNLEKYSRSETTADVIPLYAHPPAQTEGDQAPAAYRETVEKVAAAREKRLTELVEDLTAIFNATKLYEPKRAAEIIAFVRNRASHTLSSTNLGSGVRDV